MLLMMPAFTQTTAIFLAWKCVLGFQQFPMIGDANLGMLLAPGRHSSFFCMHVQAERKSEGRQMSSAIRSTRSHHTDGQMQYMPNVLPAVPKAQPGSTYVGRMRVHTVAHGFARI